MSDQRPAWAKGEQIDIPRGDLVQFIDDVVAKHAGKPAFDFMDREISYAEFGRLVDKAAKGLQERGAGPGVKVGLCMPNSPYYPVMFFAALKTGAEAVNFSPAYSRQEMIDGIQDSGIKFMVATDARDSYNLLAGLLDEKQFTLIRCPLVDMTPPSKSVPFHFLNSLPKPLEKLALRLLPKTLAENYRHGKAAMGNTVPRGEKRIVTFKTLTGNNGAFRSVPHNPDDVALLQYTGGTTGVPKAAMLTHFNLVAQAKQIDTFAFPDQNQTVQEVHIAVAPYFHVLGLMAAMLLPIARGDKLVPIPDPRNQSDLLDKINRKHPTFFAGVPRQFQAIAENPKAADVDFSSLKFAIAGGSALAANVRAGFESVARAPGLIRQGYGMSETSPVLTCNPLLGANKPNSVGRALPNTEIRIVDPEDHSKILHIGEAGEIQGRGPQVMKGYYNRPDDTAKVLSDDGWFSTGDAGVIDDDGYLTITDRLKDMLKINGMQTSSVEIEKVISLHPAVAECAVIGVPDARAGEAAKAFIRYRTDMPAPTTAELKEFLSTRASALNIPKYVVVMTEEIPKTPVGKPDKKLLRLLPDVTAKPQAPKLEP